MQKDTGIARPTVMETQLLTVQSRRGKSPGKPFPLRVSSLHHPAPQRQVSWAFRVYRKWKDNSGWDKLSPILGDTAAGYVAYTPATLEVRLGPALNASILCNPAALRLCLALGVSRAPRCFQATF